MVPVAPHTRSGMEALRRQTAQSLAAMRRILGNPDLRRVEIAWIVSTAAQWALLVALLVYAYDVGGSLAVGVLGLFRTLPTLLGVPIASGFGDRHPRIRVLLGVYAIAFAATAAAVVALAVGAPLIVVFVLAGIDAVAAAAIRPVQNAMMPSL